MYSILFKILNRKNLLIYKTDLRKMVFIGEFEQLGTPNKNCKIKQRSRNRNLDETHRHSVTTFRSGSSGENHNHIRDCCSVSVFKSENITWELGKSGGNLLFPSKVIHFISSADQIRTAHGFGKCPYGWGFSSDLNSSNLNFTFGWIKFESEYLVTI